MLSSAGEKASLSLFWLSERTCGMLSVVSERVLQRCKLPGDFREQITLAFLENRLCLEATSKYHKRTSSWPLSVVEAFQPSMFVAPFRRGLAYSVMTAPFGFPQTQEPPSSKSFWKLLQLGFLYFFTALSNCVEYWCRKSIPLFDYQPQPHTPGWTRRCL